MSLLELAKKKFAPRHLTEAEVELFTQTELGKPASKLSDKDDENDPANVDNWRNLGSRTIHAECLEWLCTDREACKCVTHRGIFIQGMKIDGELALEFAQVPFPFHTWQCVFDKPMMLRYAHFPALYLRRTHTKDVLADGIRVDGWILFREKSRAEGEVNFLGCTIGGGLDLNETQFVNPEQATVGSDGKLIRTGGTALSVASAKIDGSVILRDGFRADGEVNLVGARIGGGLEALNAEFINPIRAGPTVNNEPTKLGGQALVLAVAKIDGSVLLSTGFKAQGEVSLLGATVGQTLDCSGGQLTNAGGVALQASGVTIGGSASFNKVVATGEINFVKATIGRNLECDQAKLTNPDGKALNANSATIEGNAFLRFGFIAQGELNFVAATIHGNFEYVGSELITGQCAGLDLRSATAAALRDNQWSWPQVGKLRLDGFRYDRIWQDSPLEAKARLRWLQLQPELVENGNSDQQDANASRFLPQPFEQLASVLRAMGHEGRAREVMVEKNRAYARSIAKRLSKEKLRTKLAGRLFNQEWWWHNVFGIINGYGYKPWRAFFISLAVITFGALLFQLGYDYGLISPSKENAYVRGATQETTVPGRDRKISDEYPKFNSIAYSLESFTPLLKLDQSASWMPNANRSDYIIGLNGRLVPFSGGFLRGYLWCHIVAGWVLTSLWVGGLTGLVKT